MHNVVQKTASFNVRITNVEYFAQRTTEIINDDMSMCGQLITSVMKMSVRVCDFMVYYTRIITSFFCSNAREARAYRK